MRRFLCVFLLLVLSSAVALAAGGRIAGTVTDPTGAPLPGVTVTIVGTVVTRTITTNPEGRFSVEVPPGRYTVSAELPGFTTARVELMVVAGRTVTPTLVMQVGALAETISVGAVAPLSLATAAISGRDFPRSAPWNTESYSRIDENPFFDVRQHPLSTFSIDVDTASYANVRRFLSKEEELPPRDAVRIEELINYFRYDYPAPSNEHPLGVTTEIGACPWAPSHRLALVGLQARTIPAAEVPPRNLVFLVDVSGSMNAPNKLPLVKSALRLLVPQLTAKDRVALVVYAGSSGLVLDATPGDRHDVILDALGRLEAGGSTNGAEGIELAYDVATRNVIPGGINRVILCTDGDFNVGTTDEGELTRLIEKERARGVFLSVLGFGMGNLKDSTMEMLADRGDGNYAYIDAAAEARKVLGAESAGTLLTVARDVKLQVEFNPRRVSSYRLIGYENRLLEDEDFDDDARDAGELGAAQSVTALYEVVPAGIEGTARPAVDLRYQEPRRPSGHAGSPEWMTVKVRYKRAEGGGSRRLIVRAAPESAGASAILRFASSVAAFGMLLRDSAHKGGASFEMVEELARSSLGKDEAGYRAEFVALVDRGRRLTAEWRAAQR